MPILPFKGQYPEISASAWVAPDAWVTGRVSLAADVSVFFGACLRGDLERITVGEGSNIQEQSVLHTTHDLCDCIVGPRVTVGHGAILHSCNIEGFCIVGMGATVLDKAVVHKNCIIGANSLIPVGMNIPEGSMIYGSPAKVVRKLSDQEIWQIADSARRYIEVGRNYKTLVGAV